MTKVSGKKCINCGREFFLPYDDAELLNHDKLHYPYTGWIELKK